MALPRKRVVREVHLVRRLIRAQVAVAAPTTVVRPSVTVLLRHPISPQIEATSQVVGLVKRRLVGLGTVGVPAVPPETRAVARTTEAAAVVELGVVRPTQGSGRPCGGATPEGEVRVGPKEAPETVLLIDPMVAVIRPLPRPVGPRIRAMGAGRP